MTLIITIPGLWPGKKTTSWMVYESHSISHSPPIAPSSSICAAPSLTRPRPCPPTRCAGPGNARPRGPRATSVPILFNHRSFQNKSVFNLGFRRISRGKIPGKNAEGTPGTTPGLHSRQSGLESRVCLRVHEYLKEGVSIF